MPPPLKCGGATIAMVNYSLGLLLASLLKWHLLSTATDSHSFKLLRITQVKLWEASDILSPSQEAPNWQLDNTVLFPSYFLVRAFSLSLSSCIPAPSSVSFSSLFGFVEVRRNRG